MMTFQHANVFLSPVLFIHRLVVLFSLPCRCFIGNGSEAQSCPSRPPFFTRNYSKRIASGQQTRDQRFHANEDALIKWFFTLCILCRLAGTALSLGFCSRRTLVSPVKINKSSGNTETRCSCPIRPGDMRLGRVACSRASSC